MCWPSSLEARKEIFGVDERQIRPSFAYLCFVEETRTLKSENTATLSPSGKAHE